MCDKIYYVTLLTIFIEFLKLDKEHVLYFVNRS